MDGATRLLAEHLRAAWNQTVIVDNKVGGGSSIGSAAVAKAAPDGYTLLLASQSITTIKTFLRNPGFDPTTELVPIAQVADIDMVLSVSKDLPVKDLAGLVSYARSDPEKIFHASGAGGLSLLFEQFAEAAGIKGTQVPYKGEQPALTAVAAGDAPIVVSSVTAARPLIDAGRIRGLAVPSLRRSLQAPAIPTSAEAGVPGFQATAWIGLLAPAGTPVAILQKIDAEVARFTNAQATARKLVDLGVTPRHLSRQEFGSKLKLESEKWAKLATRTGIKPE